MHANSPKIGKKTSKNRMTEEILEKMEERKKAENTPAYEIKNKGIKKSCKKEKENWYNNKCDEIEKYLEMNGTKRCTAA